MFPVALHIALRTLAVALLMGSTVVCMAQRDGSLTPEFARLSAKQRARIAAQEELDAQADTAYQRRMTEAEGLFKEGRFDDALSIYHEARTLRPYNVHPKVKIQDLEALIARRDAEAQPLPATETVPARPVKVPVPVPQAPSVEIGSVKRKSLTTPVVPPSNEAVDRIFKEGRAVVHERVVIEGTRTQVWRKVVHPWGEVVYFKDGKAVSEHQWSARFDP
ncbi:MAG: hypothetical protein IPO05_12445 [Flavobacteriales bacterium]|jgi:hypothetical protein|nr:hypothetical protein [Flavobacteriales bacterium]